MSRKIIIRTKFTMLFAKNMSKYLTECNITNDCLRSKLIAAAGAKVDCYRIYSQPNITKITQEFTQNLTFKSFEVCIKDKE